jgi:hypothetical protein
MHSSDAPSPSEECIGGNGYHPWEEAILSSDAPYGYSGRKQLPQAPGATWERL